MNADDLIDSIEKLHLEPGDLVVAKVTSKDFAPHDLIEVSETLREALEASAVPGVTALTLTSDVTLGTVRLPLPSFQVPIVKGLTFRELLDRLPRPWDEDLLIAFAGQIQFKCYPDGSCTLECPEGVRPLSWDGFPLGEPPP